jgi:hypothetical protein
VLLLLFPAWAEATNVTVKSKRLNFMALDLKALSSMIIRSRSAARASALPPRRHASKKNSTYSLGKQQAQPGREVEKYSNA